MNKPRPGHAAGFGQGSRNSSVGLSISAAITVLVLCPASSAQLAPASAAAPFPARDEIVELSPFSVNTDRDVGYQAENTLSGSRLNTKLRDTPGSVSVFTKEFLDDLGITDVRQLVDYSVNSEVDTASGVAGTAQNSFLNAQNLNNNINTRGISASQGLDYFTSIVPGDAYRIGRYDDSRGPNSILFGIGSAGGIINQSSKIAVTHGDSGNIRYSVGSWNRGRLELDANKVLQKDRLALAFSLLNQENNGWRNFDFQDKRRVFGSVTFRPIPRLAFQVMGETGRDFGVVMRSTSEPEEVLAWYDNRQARGVDAVTVTPGTALPTAAQVALGIVNRAGASGGSNHRVTFLENNSTVFDAIGTYVTGTYNNSAVRAPDGSPGKSGATLRINDPRIYPYFNNATGPGMNRNQTVSNYTLTADWQPAKNLFVNLGHNYQKTDVVVNLMVGATPVLRGDPNRTLGLNGPANPYAGRLYFDGEWRRDVRHRDREESRASISYTLDSKSKWLGTHRLVGLVSHVEDYDERATSWLVLAGRPFNADPINANNRVTVRNYLTEGDYSTYRVGDWRSLPNSITFGGRTYQTAYANDAASAGTNGGSLQKTDGGLGVVQSHFLRDRLVTTLGYRRDRAKIIQMGSYNDPIRGDVTDRDPAKQTSSSFTATTRTAGVVLHLLDWLSLFGNRASSVGLPSADRTVFPRGELASAPEGTGTDYGLGFDLLGGRLNAKLSRFTTTEAGAVGAYGAQAFFNDRNQRVLDAFSTVLVGNGLPFSQSQWDTIRKTYGLSVSGSLTDFDSSGYEARITANLKPNWRLVLNYSYTDSGRANLFKDATAWYGVKPGDGGLLKQGASQNAAGQYVVDASAYEAGGTVAKWLELGAMRPAANPTTLVTSANVTVAREIYNLVDDMNGTKQEQEKRWSLRPHKVSFFTSYDFKEGWVKGFSVGGGWRWRSANVIGTNASGEVTGRVLSSADLMLRYGHKIKNLPGKLTFQINVYNALDNTAIIPQRLLRADDYVIPGGRGPGYGRYDLVDPRDIRFTTTYSF